MDNIEIPFGAKDSELCGWEYTIPEGFEAEIKDGKIIVREKESEDERIRSAMIRGFNSMLANQAIGTFAGEPIKNILLYLEKQKEQDKCPEYCVRSHCIDCTIYEKQKEQNDNDEECTDFTIYHPLKNGKGEYECIPYSFYGSLTSFSEDKDLIDFLRTCFYTKEECNEWIEKQKEQKDYRKLYEDIAKSEWFKKSYHGKSLGIEDEHQSAEMDNKEIELSDFESELFSAFSDGCREGVDVAQWAKEHSAQLLNVAKQELKPVEWSEEDEKIRQKLIRFISSPNIEKFMFASDEQMFVSWLKALRPMPKVAVADGELWKPSEEQMTDLFIAAREGCEAGSPTSNTLKTLYKDLEKL